MRPCPNGTSWNSTRNPSMFSPEFPAGYWPKTPGLPPTSQSLEQERGIAFSRRPKAMIKIVRDKSTDFFAPPAPRPTVQTGPPRGAIGSGSQRLPPGRVASCWRRLPGSPGNNRNTSCRSGLPAQRRDERERVLPGLASHRSRTTTQAACGSNPRAYVNRNRSSRSLWLSVVVLFRHQYPHSFLRPRHVPGAPSSNLCARSSISTTARSAFSAAPFIWIYYCHFRRAPSGASWISASRKKAPGLGVVIWTAMTASAGPRHQHIRCCSYPE